MMNRRVQEIALDRADNQRCAGLLASTALLITMVFVLCGCTQQSDGGVFKVQSGEKTLLDIKKNPEEKVSIEVDVPKVNFKMKDNSHETVERTTVTETQSVNVVPAPAPYPVPNTQSTN